MKDSYDGFTFASFASLQRDVEDRSRRVFPANAIYSLLLLAFGADAAYLFLSRDETSDAVCDLPLDRIVLAFSALCFASFGFLLCTTFHMRTAYSRFLDTDDLVRTSFADSESEDGAGASASRLLRV